jgi:hypothetical protein
MLPLGHAGITLGAAVLLNGTLSKAILRQPEESLEMPLETPAAAGNPSGRLASWFSALGGRLDIRILLVGSLLPDIIDKPVGQLFFREDISSGRIYSHTLLFLIIITLAGFLLYRSRGRTWLLALSFGTFTHLIFDQMWLVPQDLLWPFYGFAFERVDLTDWPQRTWLGLLTDPEIYIPEIIGGVVLVLLLWVLVRNRLVLGFIRRGRLAEPPA